MRWFTADLHLGHAPIIGYSGRPFHHAAEMNASLIANWNSVVGNDDEVWVLGDVAMGRIEEQLPLCSMLTGRKILVVGNHDLPFTDGPDREVWTELYMETAGFDEVMHGDTVIDVGGVPVRLSHFPFDCAPTDHDAHVDSRPPDDGGWLLHGHVHTGWRQLDRMINVGVDAWSGFPVPESTIIDSMAGPASLDRLEWTR